MSLSCFTEKKTHPTGEQICAALGSRFDEWQGFLHYIREKFGPTEEIKFLYGKNYGWAVHFKRNRKMLINLYPNQGYYVAQINLPEIGVQRALRTDLNPYIREVIEHSPQFPEGRWLFIPVKSEEDLSDVKKLLDMRIELRLS